MKSQLYSGKVPLVYSKLETDSGVWCHHVIVWSFTQQPGRSVSRKLVIAYVYIRGDGQNTRKCLILICRHFELDP